MLRKTVSLLFGLFAIASISLGIIMLVSGYQTADDPQVNVFRTTAMGIALILLPIAILFVAKTVRSYRALNATYGLPDLPARPLLLAGGSILLFAIIVVIIAMYLFFLQSPA